MAEAFALAIGRWVEKQKGNLDAIVRKIELDISARVIMRTPVRTGRARANWFPSQGAPSASVTTGTDPSGGTTIATVASFGRSLSGPRTFFLTNNLPYIERLEHGWSRQAPSGMVGLTVREFQAIVGDAAASVK